METSGQTKARGAAVMDIEMKCTPSNHFGTLLPAVIVVSVIAISCGSDPASDTLEPIEDVSFASDIQPMFTGSCGGSGCHIESSQSGVNLSTYASVMNSTGTQYNRAIVEPGQADQSPVVDKIEPAPEHGERMPLGRPSLSDRQIEEVRVWINEGALEN